MLHGCQPFRMNLRRLHLKFVILPNLLAIWFNLLLKTTKNQLPPAPVSVCGVLTFFESF